MVQWQICTVDHLISSGFGRSYPRHGLQLLFWFANQCETCEPFVVTIKLLSDCQPENGSYGFHRFGNTEGLLPVLDRPRKSKTKFAYFEVGNLNTNTYPASADLPIYVRENCGFGNYNIDRIIISYQARTRIVERVYVTEHDESVFGRFDPDRTHEISSELIRTLQNPQLDLTTFLTQMGYYEDINGYNNREEIYPEPSAQQALNNVQTYSGSSGMTVQIDDFQFFSEGFNQPLHFSMEPFSCASYNSGPVANYSKVQQKYRRPKATRRPRASMQSYWMSEWELQPYRGYYEEPKRRSGGGFGGGGDGFSFVKILLGVGALYLAAKCFSWLRSCWNADLHENVLKSLPWMTPRYRHTHTMLDYV